MSNEVSMEHAAVRNFLSQLDEHLSNHTTHFNNTHGTITANIASYRGSGGSASHDLLPLLEDSHNNMVNGLTDCTNVLNQHLSNNASADDQQQAALKKAHAAVSGTITNGLT